MTIKTILAASLFAAALLPVGAQAQGLIGGAREGAAQGNRAAGPVGAVVGGAVGAGVGTVNGALGIHPAYYHGHRCYWAHGYRHCRW